MPSPVDKYFDEVKKGNPSYSDEQAWATAWSIYCKYKNPGSDHCKKPTSEYLKGKAVMSDSIWDFKDALIVRKVVARTADVQPTEPKKRTPSKKPTREDVLLRIEKSDYHFLPFDEVKPNERVIIKDLMREGLVKLLEPKGKFPERFVVTTKGSHALRTFNARIQLFQDALLARNVLVRYAGAVVPFKPKTGVPYETIAGRRYVLSTDGGPLGDRDDPNDMGWMGRSDGEGGGARIIDVPQTGSKFKYLWAYDTDKQYVAMWRVTDGNEKFGGRASSEQARIVRLDKKGQLNRVTHEEFRKIEMEMRKREDDTMRALQKSIEDNKDEATKLVDQYVREFFDKYVESKLNRALDAVERGATPMGFKPFGPGESDPEWRKRQMASHVLGQIFQREMTLDKVEEYLRGRGIDVEAAGQWVNWAIDDVRDAAAEKFLPPRPQA